MTSALNYNDASAYDGSLTNRGVSLGFFFHSHTLSGLLFHFLNQNLVCLNPRFSVTQLLERIGEVVEQNHLFTSDGPTLGEELESLQRHLESLSSAQSPLETGFNTSHGLKIHTHTFSHTHVF